jgi:hypothetical protein
MELPVSILKKNLANDKAIIFVNDSKQLEDTFTKKLKHMKPQFNLLFSFGGKADRPVANSGASKKRALGGIWAQ